MTEGFKHMALSVSTFQSFFALKAKSMKVMLVHVLWTDVLYEDCFLYINSDHMIILNFIIVPKDLLLYSDKFRAMQNHPLHEMAKSCFLMSIIYRCAWP